MSIEDNSPLPKNTVLGLLSGILSNDENGILNDMVTLRRYHASVDMSTQMARLPDACSKAIIYEIGLSYEKQLEKLKPLMNKNKQWQQAIRVNDVISNQLTALHKRYSNFTGVYDYIDLSAIGYHLAKCIAKYNNTGILTANEMRCNKNINVRVLGVSSDPITANDAAVYVPRTTSTLMAPGTFNAIMNACNAYGTTVYTDVLEMDGNNQPVVIDAEGAELVSGCYSGLRVLLSMYNLSKQGPVMAYAIVKGFHTMNSVVSHTDEGGFLRDVLRNSDFVPPHGGIYMDAFSEYTSLPMPNIQSDSQLCACVDSILLSSAAMVAVSDPCVDLQGRLYPRVYATNLTQGRAKKIASDIYADCGSFARSYVNNLGKLFNVEGIDTCAEKHLIMSFAMETKNANRHLDHPAVAPYFWIEPTSILPRSIGGVATEAGYGPLCSVGYSESFKAVPEAKIAISRTDRSLVGYEHRTARTVPLLQYLQGHVQNGLAFLQPWNFVSEYMAFKGNQMIAGAARDQHKDMREYLWGRGQSQILAPAEMMYIGKTMGTIFAHHTLNPDMTITMNHVYNLSEVLNAEIEMVASKPTRIENNKMSQFPRMVRREHNQAVKAMESARQFMRTMGICGGEVFVTSNTELVFDEVDEKSSNFANVVTQVIEPKRERKTGPPARRVYHDQPLRTPQAKNPVIPVPVKSKIEVPEIGSSSKIPPPSDMEIELPVADAPVEQ